MRDTQQELEAVKAELKEALEDSLGIEDPYVLYLRRRVEELTDQINLDARATSEGWVM